MKVIDKAVQILDLFTRETPELSFTDILRRTGFPRSSVHEFLSSLEQHHLLFRSPSTQKYTIGPKAFALGCMFQHQGTLAKIAYPYIFELSQQYEMPSFFCVPMKLSALCLENIEVSHYVPRVRMVKGSSLPYYAGACPLALIAYFQDERIDTIANKLEYTAFTKSTIKNKAQLMAKIQEVRKAGYAYCMEDLTEGFDSIGAPVFDGNGVVVGSSSLTDISTLFRKKNPEKIAEAIITAMKNMSKELGYTQPPQ